MTSIEKQEESANIYEKYQNNLQDLKEDFPDGLVDLVDYIDNQKDPLATKQTAVYEKLNNNYIHADALQDVVSLIGDSITNKPRQTGLQNFSHLDRYVTQLIQSTSTDNQGTGA